VNFQLCFHINEDLVAAFLLGFCIEMPRTISARLEQAERHPAIVVNRMHVEFEQALVSKFG
jgi:hypothetical protein